MHRYAVLHDVTSADGAPTGLALDMDGHVLVHVPRDYGIRKRHSGEYKVLQPDMTYVVYRPGDPGYFEQVLGDLSWTFGIGEQGEVENADDETLLRLYVQKVDRPRERYCVGEYGIILTFSGGHESYRQVRPPHRRELTYRPEADETAALSVAARGVVV